MEHPDHENLITFYRDEIGLDLVDKGAPQAEFDTAPVRLFVDQGDKPALIFELIVDNLEAAKEDLIARGCEIVRWEGKGKTCYVRDPFGFMFNVWEEPLPDKS